MAAAAIRSRPYRRRGPIRLPPSRSLLPPGYHESVADRGGSMSKPRLVGVREPDAPEGVVIVLHGGAARRWRDDGQPHPALGAADDPRRPPHRPRRPRPARGHRLLNSYRGWDTPAHPVHDAAWAVDQVRQRYGDVPVSPSATPRRPRLDPRLPAAGRAQRRRPRRLRLRLRRRRPSASSAAGSSSSTACATAAPRPPRPGIWPSGSRVTTRSASSPYATASTRCSPGTAPSNEPPPTSSVRRCSAPRRAHRGGGAAGSAVVEVG